MRLTVFTVLGLLLAAGSAIAEPRLITHPLSNGMTVVLAPNVPAETIAIHLTFDAGSRLDPRQRHGTAWLANQVIRNRLRGFETDVNPERAVFSAEVPVANLPAVLRELSHALGDRTVSGDQYLRARESAKNGGPPAQQLLLQLVYGTRSHGHLAQTLPSTVRREDVERFLRTHYRPSSGVLALAGTFDEQAVLAIVKETAGAVHGERAGNRARRTGSCCRGKRAVSSTSSRRNRTRSISAIRPPSRQIRTGSP